MTFKSKIYGMLSAFWAFIIFFNSFQVGTQSEALSSPIMQKIASIIQAMGLAVDTHLLHIFVRKSAHLGVFFILGVLITLCFASQRKKLSSYYGTILFLCLAGGVADETIQSFIVGRSSEVRDILIDFSGALLGLLVVSLIKQISAKRKYKRKQIHH